MRKKVLGCLILIFAMSFFWQLAYAANPNWQQEQKDLFAKMPVKPGDVIDKSNWQKVKDLLPPSMVEWVKRGDFSFTIGEAKYDLSMDANWEQQSNLNQGKYSLGKDLELIDKSTGTYPLHIAGDPFPLKSLDWKNDSQAGIKFIHNEVVRRGTIGRNRGLANVYWVSPTRGLERFIEVFMYSIPYWGRPDKQEDNPEKLSYQQLIPVIFPYDVSGTVQLAKRYLQGDRADDYYVYVPSIRRVKRLSGANRSDPFMGSDTTSDDNLNWDGKNESMTWKITGEKPMLTILAKPFINAPIHTTKEPNGSWSYTDKQPTTYGWMDKNRKGATWAPTNSIMVPRMHYVIEAMPKDRFLGTL